MNKIIALIFLIFGTTCAVSCQRQTEDTGRAETIVLRSVQDQFLKNFITVGPEGLSVTMARNDALFAGATAAGYVELERQVARINAVYDQEACEYWKREVQRRQALTKTEASFEGTYDRHNVLECDKFLENFVYAENGKVSLKIAEEEAVLCGATREGYRTISEDVEELNRMVQDAEVTYEEVKECFDANAIILFDPLQGCRFFRKHCPIRRRLRKLTGRSILRMG